MPKYSKHILIAIFRFLVVSLVCICCSFIVIRVFTIENIVVTGVDATISINDKKLPNNLLFFPETRVREELKKDYPQFASIDIEKKWPRTLVIHFVPRTPIALLKIANRQIALDSDGYNLGDSATGNLPVLLVETTISEVGKQILDKGVIVSLAFIHEMGQDGGIREIHIGNDRNISVRIQDMIIYLKEDGNGEEQARTLQRLLTGFRIKGSLPKSIDLRFSKPVVQL
jgi:hypothetical protein